MQTAQRMGRVDINDVEAGVLGPERRRLVPAAQVGDVLLVHGARLHGIVREGRHGQVRRAHRHLAGSQVGPVHAVVGELEPGQRAVRVNRFGHAGEDRDVPLVPQPQLDEGRDVGAVVDLALLGADHAPAAFGLDAAQDGHGGWVAVAHAVAMRHLVEAVGRRHRPDLHRLEEDVVAGIAGQGSPPGLGPVASGVIPPRPCARP